MLRLSWMGIVVALALAGTQVAAQEAPAAGGAAPPAPAAPVPGSPADALAQLVVPEGFRKAVWAAEPMVKDPVAMCFDEQGRVYVAESFRQELGVEDNRSSDFWLLDDLASQTVADRLAMYEKHAERRAGGMAYYSLYDDQVRRLTDSDGDGVADKVEDFALSFDDPLDGTGSGLLACDGQVWYTNIPHLWRLQDADGDGIAEVREQVHTGFGVRIALRGHDMHGLIMGWDGRLYWSIGDRGYDVVTREGETLHSPGSGAVFRCELDGTQLEVFHHGLRNPQELAFDDFGNLFTGDNNSDGGDRARWVYCVEGGESGWDMAYQTLEGDNRRGQWNQEKIWQPRAELALAATQPAWILPPIANVSSGPSGLVHYPGLGLPERYAGHFFLCDFRGGAANSRVLSFAVEPDGAGWRLVDEHVFIDRVLCTDVDFGWDGRVYVADWVRGWVSKGEGRIHCVWDPTRVGESRIARVTQIMKGGVANASTTALLLLLSCPDQRIRLRAQLELAARPGTTPELVQLALTRGMPQLGRIHAIWALAVIARRAPGVAGQHPLESFGELLADFDEEVRAQAARVVGDARYETVGNHLPKLLQDSSARVRYFACLGLGKLRQLAAMPAILELARENAGRDLYLRHAAVMALLWMDDLEQLLALAAKHPDDQEVQLVTLLVLRRYGDPRIARYLESESLALRTEAARAIHDLPIEAAMPALAAELDALAPPRFRATSNGIETVPVPVAGRPEFKVMIWTGFEPTPGVALREHDIFRRAADRVEISARLVGLEGVGDHYATRIFGEVEAPQTGDYVFYLTSDDNSDLYLTDREFTAGPVKLATVAGYTAPDDWDAQPSQTSAPIRLQAGKRYILEIYHREGGGLDHVAAGWRLPDGTLERPIGAEEAEVGYTIPLLRRAISAALRLGGVDNAAHLLTIAGDDGAPLVMRREALNALADWAEPSPRDRVLGCFRPVNPAAPGACGRELEAVRNMLGERLSSQDITRYARVGTELLQLAQALALNLGARNYRGVLADDFWPPSARALALEALVDGGGAEAEAAIKSALATDTPSLRARAYELVGRLDSGVATKLHAEALASGTTIEQQGALAALAAAARPEADALLVQAFDRLLAGELAAELHLDVLEAAAHRHDHADLQERLRRYQESLPATEPLADWRVTLAGGDSTRGRALFRSEVAAAQCFRCHKLGGEGGEAGPDLTGVASRLPADKLLEFLILPQAAIAPGYGTFSAMPDVRYLLSKAQIRDLVAFLRTLE